MLLVVALVSLVSLSCIFSEPLGRPAAAVAMLLVVALVSLSCIFSEPLGSSSSSSSSCGLVVVGGGASVALLLSFQFRPSGQQQLWPCCWQRQCCSAVLFSEPLGRTRSSCGHVVGSASVAQLFYFQSLWAGPAAAVALLLVVVAVVSLSCYLFRPSGQQQLWPCCWWRYWRSAVIFSEPLGSSSSSCGHVVVGGGASVAVGSELQWRCPRVERVLPKGNPVSTASRSKYSPSLVANHL